MKKFGAELKRHALTAISYMLPLVVASGLLIAIGNLMGGEVVTDLSKMTIPSALTSLGVLGMGLLPSFIAGYISYSIADRPGIAPGFLMGQIASFLGAGFLGGMVGGYIVGYICIVHQKESEGSTLGRGTDADDDYTDIIFYHCRTSDVLCHRYTNRMVNRSIDKLHHRSGSELQGTVRALSSEHLDVWISEDQSVRYRI